MNVNFTESQNIFLDILTIPLYKNFGIAHNQKADLASTNPKNHDPLK